MDDFQVIGHDLRNVAQVALRLLHIEVLAKA